MDSLTFLKELFPSKGTDQIREVIGIVNWEIPEGTPEQKMERMYVLLCREALTEIVQTPFQANQPENYYYDCMEEIDDEGAVGFQNDSTLLNSYFNQLKNMFPNVSETYLRDICNQRGNFNINRIIDQLTKDGSDHIFIDSSSIWNRLKEALPKADPSYLKKQADKLAMEDPNQLEIFVNAAIENNDYPTMEEYLKQKQEDDKLIIYQPNYPPNEFLNKLLEIIPDPVKHFEDPSHPDPLQEDNVPDIDIVYAKAFLYNKYPDIRKRHIDLAFKIKKRHLLDCCNYLDIIKKGLKSPRFTQPLPECKNLPLLQEVAYLRHRELIKGVLKYKDDIYRQFKKEAQALQLLETCGICLDDDLIPERCFICRKGCVFCKNCVQKYVEIKMGEGLTTFPCCNCDSEFGLHVLQLVMPEQTFQRLLIKIQSEEIKRANVDGMESCAFCDFVGIPPENSHIFKCENPICLKEMCRLCRNESHIPLRCEEVEYDEDVRRRTYIENMMTEALARTCYSCHRKFVKSSGCNKMTCTCGALMCYLCCKPITGYDHFSELPTGCQLITNDGQLNLDRIMQNAQKAKQDLGNVEIKFDPTVGIENFFST